MSLSAKIKSFAKQDITERLISGYQKIPALYRGMFWTLFIVLNIVFAFHTINFFWSNHEWPLMKGSISPTAFWYEARFTQTIPYLLLGSRILPVLMNLFGFFGLSLSVVALAVYWKIPPKKTTCLYFGLAMALMPYNLVWMYHTAQTSYFWGAAIIVAALELFERKRGCSVYWNVPVILLFFFALGMNASFINTILICLIGRYFIEFMQQEKLTVLLKKIGVLFLDIFVAAALLKGCVLLAEYTNVLAKNFYNTQHISIGDIPFKIRKIIPYLFEQLTITYPFVDQSYLWILWTISLVALVTVFCLGIKRRGFVLGTLGCGGLVLSLLFVSQLTTLIAKGENIQFWFRVTGYFGHYYTFSFMVALLCCFLTKPFLKNILFLLLVPLIVMSIHRDMYAMRVWKQGMDAENKVMDRVMARIEGTEGFRYSQQYGIVLLGDFSLRGRYYDKPYKDEDVSVLGWSYRAPWETKTFFNFYAPTDFIYTNYRDYWNFKFADRLLPKLSLDTLEFIQKKAKEWPDKNSVFIKNGVIFVVLEKEVLDGFKTEVAHYLRKNPILKEKRTLKLNHPNWADGVGTFLLSKEARYIGSCLADFFGGACAEIILHFLHPVY